MKGTTMANSTKFNALRLNQTFWLRGVPCVKVSYLTYVDQSDPTLGETHMDPTEDPYVTMEPVTTDTIHVDRIQKVLEVLDKYRVPKVLFGNDGLKELITAATYQPELAQAAPVKKTAAKKAAKKSAPKKAAKKGKS